MIAVSGQMKREGKRGLESIPELSHRALAVQRGEVPCPAIPDCEHYQKSLAKGLEPKCAPPRQLSFADLTARGSKNGA